MKLYSSYTCSKIMYFNCRDYPSGIVGKWPADNSIFKFFFTELRNRQEWICNLLLDVKHRGLYSLSPR